MTTQAPETLHTSSAFSNVAMKQGYHVGVAFEFMRREHLRVLGLKAGRLRWPMLVTTRGTPEKYAYRVETVWTYKLGEPK